MAELNNPGCSLVVGGNTGIPGCVFTPSNIIGAILIDKSKTISAASVATIISALQTKTLATGKDRIYPIFRFEEVTDNSEDEVIATLGYGTKQIVREGKYDLTFRLTKGGTCLQNKLRAFNTIPMRVLFVDSNNTIIGTLNPDGDIIGLACDFIHAKKMKMADGSNPAMYHIRFALSKPEELNDNIAFIKADVDVEDNVKGLIDLALTKVTATTSGVKVKVKTACDKIDLYDTYATELADGTLWSVTKVADGSTVSITAVTADSATKSFNVAFTGAEDTSYDITLASPSDLSDADVGGYPDNGYEAETLRVAIPAAEG